MATAFPPRLRWALFIVALLVGACASPPPPQPADSVEALLDAPVDQVRAAVLEVFASQRYPVESAEITREGGAEVIYSGYRDELPSPWDWILRWRFGVGRSQAEATLRPEGEASTKLVLNIIYEGKGSLVGSWTPTEPPLQLSAVNCLRLIKNELKLF